MKKALVNGLISLYYASAVEFGKQASNNEKHEYPMIGIKPPQLQAVTTPSEAPTYPAFNTNIFWQNDVCNGFGSAFIYGTPLSIGNYFMIGLTTGDGPVNNMYEISFGYGKNLSGIKKVQGGPLVAAGQGLGIDSTNFFSFYIFTRSTGYFDVGIGKDGETAGISIISWTDPTPYPWFKKWAGYGDDQVTWKEYLWESCTRVFLPTSSTNFPVITTTASTDVTVTTTNTSTLVENTTTITPTTTSKVETTILNVSDSTTTTTTTTFTSEPTETPTVTITSTESKTDESISTEKPVVTLNVDSISTVYSTETVSGCEMTSTKVCVETTYKYKKNKYECYNNKCHPNRWVCGKVNKYCGRNIEGCACNPYNPEKNLMRSVCKGNNALFIARVTTKNDFYLGLVTKNNKAQANDNHYLDFFWSNTANKKSGIRTRGANFSSLKFLGPEKQLSKKTTVFAQIDGDRVVYGIGDPYSRPGGVRVFNSGKLGKVEDWKYFIFGSNGKARIESIEVICPHVHP
ncbi:hypothetical protein AX774_g7943 [Zancudomyces culisetae]|uniref:Uncharacterized protein n=1 Tax=Zancudomyces culisetae TaxID=1213189 RepID=A0A1R1PCG9_ZANCU|nr:hypothetical protein AX774_g7943 [Zancudomyces culisetae]|eukprot:OMH78667.1 hypothetical protein AX774_g7943 [Zancudomyces culisetae]